MYISIMKANLLSLALALTLAEKSKQAMKNQNSPTYEEGGFKSSGLPHNGGEQIITAEQSNAYKELFLKP